MTMYTKFSKLAVAALLVWASCTSAQIFAAAPVITSPLTDSVIVGTPYSYTITASNVPTSYAATAMPSTLTRVGGVISGTPTVSGTYLITIGAWNADGYDMQELLLTVSADAPVIVSETNLNGTVGVPFEYTIETAYTNPGTTYEAVGIESYAGLTFDSATGIISGTPTAVYAGDLILKARVNGAIPGQADAEPVSSIQFDEGSGTTASDSTGNGYDVTLENGASWASGKFSTGVSLDGVDDYMTLPSGVVSGLTDFTISAWVNLNTVVNWSRIFDIGTDTRNHMYLTPVGATGLHFGIASSGEWGEIVGTVPVPAGEWAHVAVTMSGSTGTLYLNGEAVGSNNAMTLNPSSLGITTNNLIGDSQYAVDPYLNGTIDQFQIYNYALTASEVTSLASTSSVEDTAVATLTVELAEVLVEITSPSTDQTVLIRDSLSFTAEATGTLEIETVQWFIDDQRVGEPVESPFTFVADFPTAGTYTVSAVATDENGNVSLASTGRVITVEPLDPLLRASDFLSVTFTDIFGREPTAVELEKYLPQIDASFESRVGVMVDLINSGRVGNLELAALIYRTMSGDWPNSDELAQAVVELLGSSTKTETFTGTIGLFEEVTFDIDLAAGFSVTVKVTPDSSNSNPLNDATLAIISPSGSQIAYNDYFNGFNPQVTFTPAIAGTYSIVVGGWGLNQGDFNVSAVTTNPGGTGIVDPNALTTALVPTYEERFSSLNTDVGFVRQLFKNKHGVSSISAFNEIRLYQAAKGEDQILSDGQMIPGYNGDILSYATQFALDNDVSGFSGPSGQPLSNLHLYSLPNDATADFQIALLLATLLEVEPTTERIAAYSGLTLEETVSLILLEYLGLDLPTPLSDAASLGDNWFYLDWFGYFSYDATASADWVYSLDFGWIYIASTEATNGFWFWSDAMSSWSWATETSPSWIYRWSDSTWVYVLSVDGGGSWLNPRSTGIWEQLSL